jgi:hypothetical protein
MNEEEKPMRPGQMEFFEYRHDYGMPVDRLAAFEAGFVWAQKLAAGVIPNEYPDA